MHTQAAHATCSTAPPGTSTGTTSGYFPNYAGSTYVINAGGGDPYFNAPGGSATFTTSSGGSFAWGYPTCAPVVSVNLGFYTLQSDYENYTESSTYGYGGAIAITRGSAVASPKNLGSNDPDPLNCKCTISTPINSEGDPINTGTGNLYEEGTDYTGAPNTHLILKRYYNSLAVNMGIFGQNWRSTYDRMILTVPGSTLAQVYRADGHIDSFRLVSGAWVSDADVTSKLSVVPATGTQTGWQVVTFDDTVENYNLAGQLTSFVTRGGFTTTLAYNTSNQLVTVTGPFGHTLTFTYNANGNVATVTGPDGGIFTYGYDAKYNLTSVTHPDSTVLTYLYGNTSYPNALTGIIDELGNTYTSWTYDSNGRATSSQHAGGADLTTVTYNTGGTTTITDALGNTHGYSYTTQFGVIKPTALTGAQVQTAGGKAFTYDSNGFIASRTDWNNNVTTYTHNALGEETSRTEAYGTSLARTISTTWHSTFHLPVQITEPNRITTYTYDATGNMLSKTVSSTTTSATRSWSWTYYASGLVHTATDPRGNVTQYAYDSYGDLTGIQDALSHVTTLGSYDMNGRPHAVQDPNGLVTSLAYDPLGRLTGRTAGSEYTVFTYDAAGNLIAIRAPDNKAVFYYGYDAAHRFYKLNDHLGNEIHYQLDAASNNTLTQVYDPATNLRFQNSFTYDTVNRLNQKLGSYGQTTTYAYDPQSNVLSVTDPLSHANSSTYDALNRVATRVDALADTTTYGYDANDNVTSVTDPRTLANTYVYDGIDDATSDTNGDTATTLRTFDAAGNVLTATDARGKTTTYTYDALNRLTKALYADGTSANYTYDTGTYGIGHLTAMTDLAGTTYWLYDQHGRVVEKQQTIGLVTLQTIYAYDSYGRLASITYPSGKVVSITGFDNAGRITSLSTGASAVTYYPFGPAETWTQSNGAAFSRTHDRDGRVSSVSTGTSTVQTLTWDDGNRLTGLAESSLPNKSFGYDATNRIDSFINNGVTTSYQYDADGNRTKLTNAAGVTNYNISPTSNRLSSLSGLLSQTFSYDAVSNLTGDGSNAFTYDARGRMASVVAGGATTSYLINGLGQRIGKTGSAVPTGGEMYFYDEAGHLLGEYDSSGNVIEETVWLPDTRYGALTMGMIGASDIMGGARTPDASPVAVMTGTGTGAATYAISPDWLNAPYIISDASGAVVWWWDHYPFGDNPPSVTSLNYNPRFPGQTYDAETGLHDNGFRSYNPLLGRYLQADPIGLAGGVNRFAYAKGNPLALVDFFGRDCSPGGLSDITQSLNSNFIQVAVNGPYMPGGETFTPMSSVDPLDPQALNQPVSPNEQQKIADTMNIIQNGSTQDVLALNPHPYTNYPSPTTGAVLPQTPSGYTVFDVPGNGPNRGVTRVIIDNGVGGIYYTNNHYSSFYSVTTTMSGK